MHRGLQRLSKAGQRQHPDLTLTPPSPSAVFTSPIATSQTGCRLILRNLKLTLEERGGLPLWWTPHAQRAAPPVLPAPNLDHDRFDMQGLRERLTVQAAVACR